MSTKNMSAINADNRNTTYMAISSIMEQIGTEAEIYRTADAGLRTELNGSEIDEASLNTITSSADEIIRSIDQVSATTGTIKEYLNKSLEDAQRIKAKANASGSAVNEKLKATSSKLTKR